MAIIHSLRSIDPAAEFRQPIMEVVNERSAYPPQVRLVFGEDLPQFMNRSGNFEGL